MVRSYEKIMADMLQIEDDPLLQGLDLAALAREMYRCGKQDGYDGGWQDGYDDGYRDGVDVTVRDADHQLK